MGSGELQVNSGTPKLTEGTFAYNVADWKPVVDYRAGTTGELKISQPNSSGSSFGNSVNKWDVKLNGGLPLDVTANLGRARRISCSEQMNLTSVEMNIGAGKVTMDLRGEPKHDYTVQIRGGVGETVVYSAEGRRHCGVGNQGHRRHQHRGARKSGRRVGQPRSHRRAGDGSPGCKGRRWGDTACPVNSGTGIRD